MVHMANLNYTPTAAPATAPDPIFALTNCHRTAWRKASRARNLTTEMVDAHCELYDRIQATTPTTLAGHLAKARYLLVETIANGMDAGGVSDHMHQAETVLDEMSAVLA
jgi:hypothetical protein